MQITRIILTFVLATLIALPTSGQEFGPFDLRLERPGKTAVTESGLSDEQARAKAIEFFKGQDAGSLEFKSSDGSGTIDAVFRKDGDLVRMRSRSQANPFLENALFGLPEDIAQCQANVDDLVTGLKFWSDDHPGEIPSDLGVLEGMYLQEIPICPASPRSPYSYERKENKVTIACSNVHASAGGLDGPKYEGEALELVFDSGFVDTDENEARVPELSNSDRGREFTTAELLDGIENRHPAYYFTLAAQLFEDGRKDESVFWYYSGQLRFRHYLADNEELQPDEDPAVMSALIHTLGPPINQYAYGDLPKLLQTIDEVIRWDEETPNGFFDKARAPEARQEIIEGLLELRRYIVDKADTIREERSNNGLENRTP